MDVCAVLWATWFGFVCNAPLGVKITPKMIELNNYMGSWMIWRLDHGPAGFPEMLELWISIWK
jgi:hypothetical protein